MELPKKNITSKYYSAQISGIFKQRLLQSLQFPRKFIKTLKKSETFLKYGKKLRTFFTVYVWNHNRTLYVFFTFFYIHKKKVLDSRKFSFSGF